MKKKEKSPREKFLDAVEEAYMLTVNDAIDEAHDIGYKNGYKAGYAAGWEKAKSGIMDIIRNELGVTADGK